METAFEKILTNSYKAEMISYVAAHPKSFKEAIKLTMADKQPYSWRAAWLLWSCMKKNDQRILKHVKDLIKVLPNRKDNQQREILKILQQMEIKEEIEGLLFDQCVTIWEKIAKQPSVRFNAFVMLTKIAQRYPELSQEIYVLTQDQYMESLSPAVGKSITKMINSIKSKYSLKQSHTD
jgi:hypothetical protein